MDLKKKKIEWDLALMRMIMNKTDWKQLFDGISITENDALILIKALEKISNEDFRGNRPESSRIAFNALKEFKETLDDAKYYIDDIDSEIYDASYDGWND